MEMGGPLLAVRDLQASLDFYRQVLGLEVVNDYGANVVLTGGLSLQTLDSWPDFLGKAPEEIAFGGNDAELYFVAGDYDAFLKLLKDFPQVELLHPPLEHRWGQRAVRLYDPDRHIVEVAESLARVCRRFLDGGLSEEGVARRMDIPLGDVQRLLRRG